MNMKNASMPILVILVSMTFISIPVLASSSSADDSTFNYTPLNVAVQAAPGNISPQSIPLCKTTSGINITCYSPDFIRTAYNFPNDLDGSGQTIVIVDAYGSPTITNDLAVFDSHWGLPAPPSFTIVCPPGGCPSKTLFGDYGIHEVEGWAFETSLDVEYAHAMAPGANIVLEVAAVAGGGAINVAEAQAIKSYPGSIMSQSFGTLEFLIHNNNIQLMQAEMNYAAAKAEGITVLASAGDSGASNGYGSANAQFPASDPLVTAVGGTMGNPFFPRGTLTNCATGTCSAGLVTFSGPCSVSSAISTSTCTPVGYGGEQVWNELPFAAAGGGAPSLLFGAPNYQDNSAFSVCTGTLGSSNPNCMRTIPDVSYDAAVSGGVLVFTSFLGANIWFIAGGTSAGSPQWAAIFALVNQERASKGEGPLGFANPALYSIGESSIYTSNFHDITTGNNTLVGSTVGFSAGPGYDLGSGWGTPNVANLVSSLSS
ncbi:MAG: S53 family peptidase [Thaumarchaeota archaeon]|nr:S53 family peptidase [Nitrososphaerota archaeon]